MKFHQQLQNWSASSLWESNSVWIEKMHPINEMASLMNSGDVYYTCVCVYVWSEMCKKKPRGFGVSLCLKRKESDPAH